jgi:hypothetical protein
MKNKCRISVWKPEKKRLFKRCRGGLEVNYKIDFSETGYGVVDMSLLIRIRVSGGRL